MSVISVEDYVGMEGGSEQLLRDLFDKIRPRLGKEHEDDTIEQVLRTPGLMEEYVRKYLSLKKKHEVVVPKDPELTPCGKSERKAVDDMMRNCNVRSLAVTQLNPDVYAAIPDNILLQLDKDQISIISDNLSSHVIKALGPKYLLDLKDAERVKFLSDIDSSTFAAIGSRNLVHMSLEFLRNLVYTVGMTCEKIEIIGSERLAILAANNDYIEKIELFATMSERRMKFLEEMAEALLSTALISASKLASLNNLTDADIALIGPVNLEKCSDERLEMLAENPTLIRSFAEEMETLILLKKEVLSGVLDGWDTKTLKAFGLGEALLSLQNNDEAEHIIHFIQSLVQAGRAPQKILKVVPGELIANLEFKEVKMIFEQIPLSILKKFGRDDLVKNMNTDHIRFLAKYNDPTHWLWQIHGIEEKIMMCKCEFDLNVMVNTYLPAKMVGLGEKGPEGGQGGSTMCY